MSLRKISLFAGGIARAVYGDPDGNIPCPRIVLARHNDPGIPRYHGAHAITRGGRRSPREDRPLRLPFSFLFSFDDASLIHEAVLPICGPSPKELVSQGCLFLFPPPLPLSLLPPGPAVW